MSFVKLATFFSDQKNYGSRIQFGLKPKIHVNQFNSIGGIQAGVKYKGTFCRSS
jgi:hypothetical protein